MTVDSTRAAPPAGPPAVVAVRDHRCLLVAPSGVSALLSSRGATLVALHAPDRQGRFADVVLGFDTAAEYAAHEGLYVGCTIGRVASRIREARFPLGGSIVRLAANEGRNQLHGGPVASFDRVEWEAAAGESPAGPRVVFRHVSPDGEEGYPGRLDVTVTYTLTEVDELWIEYEARTDQTTPVNLTNHTYWNLAGAGAPSVLDHRLEVAADHHTPTDEELLPTGVVAPVDGSPLDFRAERAIGEGIALLEGAGVDGYDHNLVLRGGRLQPAFAARLRDPGSGRVVEVLTTQPCLQLYSGNSIAPTRGKLGRRYGRRSGLCLEAQGYPDAVNNPGFEPVLVAPGEVYRQAIVFRLTTDAALR
jgi:aldose 1-epimerase